MGLFSGTDTSTTSTKVNTGPSQFQQPYLTDAFNGAQQAYKNSQGTPYYQGETYAGMTDAAKKALQAMTGFATGTGLGAASTISSIGNGMAGYASKAGQALDTYGASLGPDGQKATLASAQEYANNPYLQGQIDAANRDVGRTLTEQTLPGIDRAASAGGNINSSRAGIASGIAQRGAADRIADTSATMRGAAYDKGLTMARDDRDAQLHLGEAYQSLGNSGIDALETGAQTGYNAYDQITKANTAEQADRQGQDTAAFNQWQGQDTRATDLLKRYYDIVGANSWGQNGTTDETQKTPNGGIFGKLLGAAATGAGIAGGLGFKPFK